MILTLRDIECRRNEQASQPIGTLVMAGVKTQYFFKTNIEEGYVGICGLDCILLDVRRSENPLDVLFYADIAIRSYLPELDLYIEQLNIPVVTITTVNVDGVTESALCHHDDVEYITKVMSDKYRGKSALKLVINNKETK